MKIEMGNSNGSFGGSSEQSSIYVAERSSILEEVAGEIIHYQGIHLITGSRHTGREEFLNELKDKLILTGCAVFSAFNAFNSFNEYIYHYLQQQSHGDHSRIDMLPLKSDGSNLFFDNNQLTLLILDQVGLCPDNVLVELIKTITSANQEGYKVALMLADEALMNDRLIELGYQDLIVSSNILPSLDTSAVRDYIEHSMSLSDEKYTACVFSPGAIREITVIAKGNIHRVNELCQQSLQLAVKSEDQIVTVHMVKESGSDRFFKLHSDGVRKEKTGRRIQSKGSSIFNEGWLGLILAKMKNNAFASTAALIPLMLIVFYFKFTFEEQEKIDLLTKRAEQIKSLDSGEMIASTKPTINNVGDNTIKKETVKEVLSGITEKAAEVKKNNEVSSAEISGQSDQLADRLTIASPNAETIDTLVNIEPAISKPLNIVQEILGNEDTAILLGIGLGAGHDKTGRYIEISGVPEGVALSKGVRYGDVWVIMPAELQELELIPSVDKDHDYTLKVLLKDSEQQTVLAEDIIRVQVQAVADKPIMSFSGATGDQFTAIPIEIAARLADRDGSESLTVEIIGLPDTVQISAGQKNDSGVWVLSPKDLDGLIITPMDGAPTKLNLLIKAVASEIENNSRAVVSGTLDISIIPGSR